MIPMIQKHVKSNKAFVLLDLFFQYEKKKTPHRLNFVLKKVAK